MIAYGGTLPLFAAQIALLLNVAEVVIPSNSSAFSAFGLLTTDYVRRFERTVEWDTSDIDQGLENVNAVAEALADAAMVDLGTNGFSPQEITLVRTGDFRFAGQVWELTMPIGDTRLTAEDATRFAATFPKVYEQTYGPGTAWKDMPIVLLNYGITAIGRQRQPHFPRLPAESLDAAEALRGQTAIFTEPGRQVTIPVYDDRLLRPGHRAAGPAIVNAHDTTIYIPAGFHGRRDELMNYILAEGAIDA